MDWQTLDSGERYARVFICSLYVSPRSPDTRPIGDGVGVWKWSVWSAGAMLGKGETDSESSAKLFACECAAASEVKIHALIREHLDIRRKPGQADENSSIKA